MEHPELNAIIYCRVSTVDQVENGSGLEVQEQACSRFCQDKKWNLVCDPFIEAGESAKTADRTKLKRLMEYCRRNKGNIDVLVFYRISRLSRSMTDFVMLENFFSTLGIKLVSVTEPFTEGAVGNFMKNSLAINAQLENDLRAEQSKE